MPEETPFENILPNMISHELICDLCREHSEDYYAVREPEGTLACQHHSFSCHHCGGRFLSIPPIFATGNGDRICADCFSHLRICSDCETSYSTNYGHICAEYGEPSAQSCTILFEHGYKPFPMFLQSKKEYLPCRYTRYFGVELEVDTVEVTDREEDIRKVEIPKQFYCKEDSSLNYGFEIVSHPATWEWWAEADLSFMDRLQRRGYRSYGTKTCGIHIHVSRMSLTESDILKLLEFTRDNPKFILDVSRRRESALRQWAKVDCSSTSCLLDKVRHGPSARYEAINLTPAHTIEFRIFHGNLNKDGLLCNVAFVNCLISFAQQSSRRELTAHTFNKWLQGNAVRTLGKNKISKKICKWIASLV